MKPNKTYRKFVVETAKFEFPARYGYDWFCSVIDKIWECKDLNTDWTGLESLTRDCLASTLLTDAQKVNILKDAIPAFTRRGPIS